MKWTTLTVLGGTTIALAGCGDSAAPNDQEPAGSKPGELFQIGLYSWNEIVDLPRQVNELGLTHYRIGGVMSDRVMTFCAENNIDVLLNFTPEVGRASAASDAAFIAAYLKQIDRTMDRFGPGGSFWTQNPTLPSHPIQTVEICNEPNFGYGFVGTKQQVADLYAQVLFASYDHIKSRWPTVTVVGFAAGGASAAAPGFLELTLAKLQSANRLDSFDVVAVHIYSDNVPPEQLVKETWGTWVAGESLEECVEVLLKFGVHKPIWVTEAGYQISQAQGGKFPPDRAAAHGNGTVTLEQQAAYTVRLNMAAIRAGMARMYHMFMVDTDNYNGGWFDSSPQHGARPVAIAMRHLNESIGQATSMEIILDGRSDSPPGPFAYKFHTPDTVVTVAWSQIPQELKLPLSGGQQTVVTDMYGKAIATVNGDSYETRLTPNPLLLTTKTT
ncbi:hypothetical protein [Gordonia sp. CPCC 205515]|uniref:hypothetical protein n=1 Tax=Gordonia sp. CPCC 205515 TaxID=3140791 RepID=UPI003AF3FF29